MQNRVNCVSTVEHELKIEMNKVSKPVISMNLKETTPKKFCTSRQDDHAHSLVTNQKVYMCQTILECSLGTVADSLGGLPKGNHFEIRKAKLDMPDSRIGRIHHPILEAGMSSFARSLRSLAPLSWS